MSSKPDNGPRCRAVAHSFYGQRRIRAGSASAWRKIPPGPQRLTVTLPDRGALDALAQTLACLILVGGAKID